MILFLGMRCCPYRRSKSFFEYLHWLETKMSIIDGPTTLIQFIDWVGTNERGLFFIFSFLIVMDLVKG